MTKSIIDYYNENNQTFEMFEKKQQLRDAIFAMFKDIFPCMFHTYCWRFVMTGLKDNHSQNIHVLNYIRRSWHIYCWVECQRFWKQQERRGYVCHGFTWRRKFGLRLMDCMERRGGRTLLELCLFSIARLTRRPKHPNYSSLCANAWGVLFFFKKLTNTKYQNDCLTFIFIKSLKRRHRKRLISI